MKKGIEKYSHIMWDWNGTLLNDVHVCVEILNNVLKKHNKPTVTYEEYRRRFDFPVKDYYRSLGFDFTIESFEEVAADFIGEYGRRQFECKLQDGAMGILEHFACKGITQSILSAYQHDMLSRAVKFFNVRHFFVELLGLDDHYSYSKVENGRKLIGKLGIDSRKVLFIGDTVHDYEVACAIGTECILVSAGHQPKEKLCTCKTNVIESITELNKLM